MTSYKGGDKEEVIWGDFQGIYYGVTRGVGKGSYDMKVRVNPFMDDPSRKVIQ